MVVTDQKIYYLILEDGGRTEMHIIDRDEVEQEIQEGGTTGTVSYTKSVAKLLAVQP